MSLSERPGVLLRLFSQFPIRPLMLQRWDLRCRLARQIEIVGLKSEEAVECLLDRDDSRSVVGVLPSCTLYGDRRLRWLEKDSGCDATVLLALLKAARWWYKPTRHRRLPHTAAAVRTRNGLTSRGATIMAKRRFRPEDAYRLKTAAEPNLSPDARRVAYVVVEADEDADRLRSSIWVAAVDGSTPARKFSEGPADRAPRWSPTAGGWLMFGSGGQARAGAPPACAA